MEKIITNSAEETRKLGEDLARKLKRGEIICLEGDLGAGKTTFSQGLLAGLGAKGPFTSPTFLVMKNYQLLDKKIKNIYHIDTYRVDSGSILDLGWDELIASDENIIIVEWPEKISEIIPGSSMKIEFKALDENKREIVFL